jgi:glycerate dehydrogenase
MQIVVLDGYTLAPGGSHGGDALDWAPLEALGEVTIHDRTAGGEVVSRAKGAPIVLTNKTPLGGEVIERLPGLKYIGVTATGVNVVDLDAARRHGVVVTNVPGYSTETVVQHVFALLLELVVHTCGHVRAVADGRWVGCEDFSFRVGPITELAGKTMGIVGMGAIGRRVAAVADALGMRVAAAHQSSMARVTVPGVEVRWAPIDELVAMADVITLHCPLTDQTRHLINAERLARVKPTAILINTGRGDLVDEAALAGALHGGAIAGAGLDVLSSEPPAAGNPLLSAPRCVITPHIAWASIESRRRMMVLAAGNVAAFIKGEPINVVP